MGNDNEIENGVSISAAYFLRINLARKLLTSFQRSQLPIGRLFLHVNADCRRRFLLNELCWGKKNGLLKSACWSLSRDRKRGAAGAKTDGGFIRPNENGVAKSRHEPSSTQSPMKMCLMFTRMPNTFCVLTLASMTVSMYRNKLKSARKACFLYIGYNMGPCEAVI